MTLQSVSRKRKATWSQWKERRVSSEYEAVSFKFHNHFRAEPAPFELSENWSLNVFYKQNREDSPFVSSVDDWEGFRDPRAFTYRRYVEVQKDREVYLDNLIDEFESRDHYRSLSAEWLDFLRDSYLPARFPGHGMQMSAAYLGQMGPSDFVANTFYYLLGNEMRRVQRQAYLAQVLAMDTERPDLADSGATRSRWTDGPQWQGLRELIEKQLIAYDFGEAFASRNLVVRPIFDHIFNSEIATLAGANGDDLLQLMHDDFRKHDQAYAEENTKALVDYAVDKAGSNADFLREQVAKWLPLGEKAARGLAGSLASAPGADSADAIVERAIAAQRRVMDECGL